MDSQASCSADNLRGKEAPGGASAVITHERRESEQIGKGFGRPTVQRPGKHLAAMETLPLFEEGSANEASDGVACFATIRAVPCLRF